jgi:ATP-dependent exoDNAse (exonuclease V) beta subunit
MALITYNPCFTYPTLKREDRFTGRVYISPEGATLPSVTRILAATKDESALDEWKKRVGEMEAERIKTEAAYVGTAMHRVLEHVLTGEPLIQAADWLEMRGYEMGFRLANGRFSGLAEYWGAEVPLYYPGRYAGTCDLIGVWRGKPAIIDFKQSLKPKKKQWITDYFHQLAAYACAHDRMHGTQINFGVVLVACQTGETQEFTTTGPEFEDYKGQWLERVENYYTANPPEA